MGTTVEGIRDDILTAAAAVRVAARVENDAWRSEVATRIEGMFAGVTDAAELRERASDCLGLYGGMGSFSDVGTELMAEAVDMLRVPLVRARTWGFG